MPQNGWSLTLIAIAGDDRARSRKMNQRVKYLLIDMQDTVVSQDIAFGSRRYRYSTDVSATREIGQGYEANATLAPPHHT